MSWSYSTVTPASFTIFVHRATSAVTCCQNGPAGIGSGSMPCCCRALAMSSMRMMAAGSAPELSLTPEDIEVVAIVDAKFIAS